MFDVDFLDGEEGIITLDSGAGVSVRLADWQTSVPHKPEQRGLRMTAAKGSEIENLEQQMVKFRGLFPDFPRRR